MATAFTLRNGTLLLSTEAPGGIYNSAQLKTIAAICERDAVIVKATEDQRLALFVASDRASAIASELRATGLGIRHYQDGLHQPTACIGELCTEHQQDALGSAMDVTQELASITLSSPLRIGINGCARCCVPCHTLDVSVVGESDGYRLSLGGKTSQLPEMAVYMAEGVPSDQLPGLLRKIVTLYSENATPGESLQDLIDRLGAKPFIKALQPYSQDAASEDDDTQAEMAEPDAKREEPVIDEAFAELGESAMEPSNIGEDEFLDGVESETADLPLESLPPETNHESVDESNYASIDAEALEGFDEATGLTTDFAPEAALSAGGAGIDIDPQAFTETNDLGLEVPIVSAVDDGKSLDEEAFSEAVLDEEALVDQSFVDPAMVDEILAAPAFNDNAASEDMATSGLDDELMAEAQLGEEALTEELHSVQLDDDGAELMLADETLTEDLLAEDTAKLDPRKFTASGSTTTDTDSAPIRSEPTRAAGHVAEEGLLDVGGETPVAVNVASSAALIEDDLLEESLLGEPVRDEPLVSKSQAPVAEDDWADLDAIETNEDEESALEEELNESIAETAEVSAPLEDPNAEERLEAVRLVEESAARAEVMADQEEGGMSEEPLAPIENLRPMLQKPRPSGQTALQFSGLDIAPDGRIQLQFASGLQVELDPAQIGESQAVRIGDQTITLTARGDGFHVEIGGLGFFMPSSAA